MITDLFKNARLFHYTRAGHLRSILESGAISLATKYVAPWECPVVWLSLEAVWEPTATPGMTAPDNPLAIKMLSGIEELAIHESPIRFEVNPASYPFQWSEFVRYSNTRLAAELWQTAVKRGANPKLWRVSFQPIPQSEWLSVERWEDGEWESCAERGRP